MPGEIIDRPNPPPLPSHLPDSVNELLVQIEKQKLSDDVHHSLCLFQRAANYIAAGKNTFKSGGLITDALHSHDILEQ
jgi:xylulose-5-phosphate/fructose-6-phosphate phosphoketolase